VQISGPTQALSGLRTGGPVLACVVGDDDREIALALERAEVREECRHVCRTVLVDAM